jgi:FMN-dependent NADH-azoreductase
VARLHETLLAVSASARTEGSVSCALLAGFVHEWQVRNPVCVVVQRDLARDPLPHLDDRLLKAYASSPRCRTAEDLRALKLSDDVIAEVMAAHTIVLAAPMYNFSISSTLKAWIDHLCRAGVTYRYAADGPVGLVPGGKGAVVISTRDEIYTGEEASGFDFHEPYLRAVLGHIGLKDVTFVHCEGLGLGPDASALAIRRSRERLRELAAA